MGRRLVTQLVTYCKCHLFIGVYLLFRESVLILIFYVISDGFAFSQEEHGSIAQVRKYLVNLRYLNQDFLT